MFTRHPFFKFLLKMIAVILVSITTVFSSFIFLFMLFFIGIFAFALALNDDSTSISKYRTIYGDKNAKDKLLSIRVSGVILGERDELDPFAFLDTGATYGYEIKKHFYDAAEDKEIKGVILEINSPGGTIYGANAIAEGVKYYKQKTKKPVIAFISGLGASGGYLASLTSDSIYADFGSTIGSIGVIFGPFKYYDNVIAEDEGAIAGGVITENGIETTYFTGGKYKDIGNPYRKLTSEEISTMQKLVNNEYDNFVEMVRVERNISDAKIRNQIGALVYDNKLAKNLGLIDGTLNKENAYITLAQKSGLSGKNVQVVRMKKELGIAQSLLSSLSFMKEPKVLPFCNLTTSVLVFHGDTSKLCPQ